MFKDEQRQQIFDQLRERDLRVFSGLRNLEVLLAAAQRSGVRIWTCPLNFFNLVWLGIAAAWHKQYSFATILCNTLKLLQDQEHFAQSDFGKDLHRKKCQQRCRG